MRMHATMTRLGVVASTVTALVMGGCTLDSGETSPVTPYTPQAVTPYQPQQQAQARQFVILHTNDEHSHLLGFAPSSAYPFMPDAAGTMDDTRLASIASAIATTPDAQTQGGMVRRQYLINKIRAASKDPVVVVSAGDAMFGDILHVASPFAAPDYVAMALVGYDFMTLGNHDFDWGAAQLAEILKVARATTFGATVPIVSTNMSFADVSATDSDQALKELAGEPGSAAMIVPWATKVLPNGLKVGFIGLMGYEAALVRASKGKISFSVPSSGAACGAGLPACTGMSACLRGHCVDPLDSTGHIMAAAADAQAAATLLKEQEHVNLVVALSHMGAIEDRAVAAATSGIDVIIGGHSHDLLAPEVVPGQKGSKTIIVQAGDYGRKLGKLTVTVAADGAVSFDQAGSALLAIDGTLDADMAEGTDTAANPVVFSTALERARGLTQGVLGPVMAGLNGLIGAGLSLPGNDLFAPLVHSNHDVAGEAAFKESNLLQLVTDAERTVVMAGAGLDETTDYIVAVQANGIIRDSLRFDPVLHRASAADVFRALPLGASPFQATAEPGYPLVMFRLDGISLYAGADIGVTKGLESDSFFLGYAGMRVSYDKQYAAFDKSKFNPMGTGPQGRVTKIELWKGNPATWVTVFEYNPAESKPWIARWGGGLYDAQGNVAATIVVITNLYLEGFLSAFGLTPLNMNGEEFPAIEALGSDAVLAQTVLCTDPGIGYCIQKSSGAVPWSLSEVKDWGVLFNYLRAGLGGSIPDTLYAGDLPSAPRVIEITH